MYCCSGQCIRCLPDELRGDLLVVKEAVSLDLRMDLYGFAKLLSFLALRSSDPGSDGTALRYASKDNSINFIAKWEVDKEHEKICKNVQHFVTLNTLPGASHQSWPGGGS